MIATLPIITNALELGLIYSLVTLAVYLASRIARFDDFTIEGSFALGGALTVWCARSGISCLLALAIACIGGACAGIITAALRHYLRISPLMCGLVVATALFSCNLFCAGAHYSLGYDKTLFALVSFLHPALILVFLVSFIFCLCSWFLDTELGLLLKAAGDNKQFITHLGHHYGLLTALTLALANGSAALAGALFVQWSGFFSITGSIGTLVTGLTALILGEMLLNYWVIGLIVGSLVYQLIFSLIVELAIDPVFNNLLKALFIIILLGVRHLTRKGGNHA